MRACTALLVVTLVSGCSGGTTSAPPAETNDREEKLVLTAEEARQALIEMVENDERGSFLELLLPTLRTDKVEIKDKGTATLGRWRCDLAKRTFHTSIRFPRATRHQFNQWSGVFTQSSDGKWKAKVTKSRSDDGPIFDEKGEDRRE